MLFCVLLFAVGLANKQKRTPAISSNRQRQCRASEAIQAGSKPLVSLGRCSLPSWQASLPTPSTQHPLFQLSPPFCQLWRASTDSNLQGGEHPCGRSLLHACLANAAAASYWWYGVCFVGWSVICKCVQVQTTAAVGSWCG